MCVDKCRLTFLPNTGLVINLNTTKLEFDFVQALNTMVQAVGMSECMQMVYEFQIEGLELDEEYLIYRLAPADPEEVVLEMKVLEGKGLLLIQSDYRVDVTIGQLRELRYGK